MSPGLVPSSFKPDLRNRGFSSKQMQRCPQFNPLVTYLEKGTLLCPPVRGDLGVVSVNFIHHYRTFFCKCNAECVWSKTRYVKGCLQAKFFHLLFKGLALPHNDGTMLRPPEFWAVADIWGRTEWLEFPRDLMKQEPVEILPLETCV